MKYSADDANDQCVINDVHLNDVLLNELPLAIQLHPLIIHYIYRMTKHGCLWCDAVGDRIPTSHTLACVCGHAIPLPGVQALDARRHK